MKTYLFIIGILATWFAACNYATRNSSARSADTTLNQRITNPQPANLVGLWLEDDADRIYTNQAPGYEFYSNGTLKPVNISTLLPGRWILQGDELKLALKTSEKIKADTLHYRVSMNHDVLMLTALDHGDKPKEVYIRAR